MFSFKPFLLSSKTNITPRNYKLSNPLSKFLYKFFHSPVPFEWLRLYFLRNSLQSNRNELRLHLMPQRFLKQRFYSLFREPLLHYFPHLGCVVKYFYHVLLNHLQNPPCLHEYRFRGFRGCYHYESPNVPRPFC